uniref:hypothetical protein n=1 Tax=Castellaniella defragrans TaxID=75697 RepID=UPI00334084D8
MYKLSLGKQFAGRQVLLEEQEPGVWLVRTATAIPDNERWLHTAKASTDPREALDWAHAHPANDTGTDEQLQRLRDAQD